MALIGQYITGLEGIMDGKFQILKDTSAGRRQRADHVWRRRIALTALLLVLVLTSPGQTVQAQAGAPEVKVSIVMDVAQIGALHTICVGDEVQFRVRVLRKVEIVGDDELGPLSRPLPGIDVNATASGAGSISPSKATTSAVSNSPSSVVFTFNATKTGNATLVFTAEVSGVSVFGLTLGGKTIKQTEFLIVEDCKYRVSVSSLWRVPGDAHITVSASIRKAGLVYEDGNYRGTARVEWKIHTRAVGNCKATFSLESQALIKLLSQPAPGQPAMYIEYDEVDVSEAINCQEASGELDLKIRPETYTVNNFYGQSTVPISSYHFLIGPAGPEKGTISGSITRLSN